MLFRHPAHPYQTTFMTARREARLLFFPTKISMKYGFVIKKRQGCQTYFSSNISMRQGFATTKRKVGRQADQ
ncbi:hypothetical protein HMPREF1981_02434 [Bacteroides pyogenes F0041]|uniref:Uncharacterized protein n=1 Tax=Bacteroides pyogenes F0041 TaxID=1321819 RepID=U2CJT7_9BACE|nr:hypothetical protein HMPREF1981_02434 [Bacteroides pyogenes F0041]